MEIIQTFREHGLQISIVGDMLRISPRERVTPEVLKAIKANKKAIIESLKQNDIPAGSFYFVDGQIKPIPKEDIQLIRQLPYVCLRDLPPTALLLYSSVLGERFWLVTSNELIERLQATGRTVYLLEEIARLLEQNLTDPESVKTIHAIKQGFSGGLVQ